jgi:hypothetical protein
MLIGRAGGLPHGSDGRSQTKDGQRSTPRPCRTLACTTSPAIRARKRNICFKANWFICGGAPYTSPLQSLHAPSQCIDDRGRCKHATTHTSSSSPGTCPIHAYHRAPSDIHMQGDICGSSQRLHLLKGGCAVVKACVIKQSGYTAVKQNQQRDTATQLHTLIT